MSHLQKQIFSVIVVEMCRVVCPEKSLWTRHLIKVRKEYLKLKCMILSLLTILERKQS